MTAIWPVRGLRELKKLTCYGSRSGSGKLADLFPLRGMKLTVLDCHDTKVADLSPLKGLPLTELTCDFNSKRDAAILRSIQTLETINGKPAAEFWKEVEAGQLEKK